MLRTKLAALAVGATLLTAADPAAALNILLTNDDGFDAPGIQALRTALERGNRYNVTVFAPSGNRTGASASLTFSPIRVEQIEDDVFSVDATPASTVILGVSEFLTGGNRPDLVISGTNSGANIGPSTVISGTVGATIAAITELDRPIPAIAFSADLLEPEQEPDSAANRRQFRNVANFARRLVDQLASSGRVIGLAPGFALNVNYPGVAPEQIRGVRLAVQGRAPLFPPSYEEIEPNVFQSTAGPVPPARDVPGSDIIFFYRNFITIVPIDGDYTAASTLGTANATLAAKSNARAVASLQPMIQSLRP